MSINIAALVSDNLDIWTSAIERKSGTGRGAGKKLSFYGIERLRALILDLAVRGKLVPQDANDASATSLLKDVRKHQTNLVKSDQIGKSRKLALTSETPPFEIPSKWEWVQIAEIGHDWGQGEPNDDFTYIDVGSIDQTQGVIRDPTVLGAKEAPSRARKIVRPGTVIYSTVRPYLRNIAIVDREFEPRPVASTAFAIIHPFDGIEARFVYHYLRSPPFVQYVESCQTGIAYPAINDRQFFSAWFPLPAQAEQKRIVAKVDELMALCDALETQSMSAMAAHQTLIETLLATLVNSADATELAANWTWLETHFDIFFTTEISIDALKLTVLELAVRGKLVPQHVEEVPANVLVQEIIASRKKRSPRAKVHSKISVADEPFKLPTGWVWDRFDHLIDPDFPIAYGVLVPGDNESGGVPFVRIADLSLTDPTPLPEKAISADVDAQFERTRLHGGEILMGVVGSIGKLGIAPTSWAGANIARAVCRIVLSPLLNKQFVIWLLQSRFMQNAFKDDTRTLAQPTLNIKLIRLAATPVPPIEEQARIVAKIDELMALCNTLKGHLSDAAKVQKHLADAIVERAVA